MSRHIVTCVSCGRRFDANKGFYYNKATRRYTCKSCGNAQKKAARSAQAEAREQRTGMRQSLGAMIAKIACGALFLVVGLTMSNVGEILTGLIIGLALLAWALIPYAKAKKAEMEAEELAAAEAEAAANAPKRCGSCGAITKGVYCEYCGAPLEDR